MIATETTRKQTGWRVNPILIERVKEAAKRKSISANDYVESILFDATKDIESEKERNERIAKNEAFLNRFAGKWSGDESPSQPPTNEFVGLTQANAHAEQAQADQPQ